MFKEDDTIFPVREAPKEKHTSNLYDSDFSVSSIGSRGYLYGPTRYILKADILVLSITLKRLIETEISSKTSVHFANYQLSCGPHAGEILNLIIPEDLEVASAIRNYYMRRSVGNVLSGNKIAPTHQVILDYLSCNIPNDNNELTVSEQTIKLIYRLPYFYEYDVTVRKMIENKRIRISTDANKVLNFIQVIPSPFKASKTKNEFWFIDQDENYVRLELIRTDPFHDFFLSTATKQDIVVSGSFSTKQKDSDEFLVSYNWKFA